LKGRLVNQNLKVVLVVVVVVIVVV